MVSARDIVEAEDRFRHSCASAIHHLVQSMKSLEGTGMRHLARKDELLSIQRSLKSAYSQLCFLKSPADPECSDDCSVCLALDKVKEKGEE